MEAPHRTLSSTEQQRIEEEVIRRGGGDYLELRLEFGDHLATAIEARWAEDSSLDFERLLEQEIAGFGYRGLRVLAENRQRLLAKRYQQKAWCLFRAWFVWPKMLLSLLATGLIFLCFQIIAGEDVREFFFGAVALLPYLSLIPVFVKHHRVRKKQAVKVLATRYATEGLVFFILLFNGVLGFFNHLEVMASPLGNLLAALVVVALWVFAFGVAPLVLRESWSVAARLEAAA